VIEVDGLSMTYISAGARAPALENVDLAITEGEFVSVVGPSGCGKSTLMMCIAGLIQPSKGSITIDGSRVTSPYTGLGIAFQDPLLLDWRTVLGNILFQIEMRGLDVKTYRSRALDLIEQVGLKGFEQKYPWELSGGMRQRVALCRALVHEPSLLLMDEPFGALDTLTRDQMNLDLLRLCAERSTTVLLITHSIAEAVFLSNRILVMTQRPGRIIADISVKFEQARSLDVRATTTFAEYEKHLYSLFRDIGVLTERRETGDETGAANAKSHEHN
jgi:NitT/TauT family transport system ATP-binding protein